MGRGLPVMGDDVLAMAGNPLGVLITDARGPLSTPVWLYWRRDAALLPVTEALIAKARLEASSGVPADTKRARTGDVLSR
jgi:hypothetical protein